MATSNATLKCSWKTGIIYTVIIAVIAAAVIWVGLNNAMPYELTVYTADDDPISVLFTDDFYNSSMRLMMVSVIFPAGWKVSVQKRGGKERTTWKALGSAADPAVGADACVGRCQLDDDFLRPGAGCDALCRCHHAQTVCSRLCDRDGAGHGAADIGPAVF